MSRIYDKPIKIEFLDEETEDYMTKWKCHAYINKSGSDSVYFDNGATRQRKALIFQVRYFKGLEDIDFNPQYYRIVYKGNTYAISDYDDFELNHQSVRLTCNMY